MLKLFKKLKYPALIIFVKILLWLCAVLPRKVLHLFFLLFARLAYQIMKSERRKIRNNLKIAYPDLTSEKIAKMTKQIFAYLAKNAADWGKVLHFKNKEQFSNFIHIKGAHYLNEAVAKGRGVIIVGCHLGAYELYPLYLGWFFEHSIAVGAPLKNLVLDQLIRSKRTLQGMSYFQRDEISTLRLIKLLKAGQILLILIDQDSSKMKSVFVDFFGKKAATPLGAAYLASKTHCDVLTIGATLQNNKQVLTIRPPIQIDRTDNKDDILTNTQRMTHEIEMMVKEYPKQWVWFHERWKTRPAGEVQTR